MSAATRLYLIAYDIREPTRLRHVARCLQAVAIRVQYSIFLFPGTRKDLAEVLEELEAIIEPTADDVRAYALDRRARPIMRGRQLFPEEIVDTRRGIHLLVERPMPRARRHRRQRR